ncbi:MAG: GNAT family N-acetyltransferase [Elusimicrobiales bacterium]|nr:GNAT family N-acetyltransferase [Elusimicrobiales bacterium]
MNSRHVEVLLGTETDGQEIRIRNARVEDARRIQVLYSEIYGPTYPIPVISDREKMKKALASDDYFWLVGEHNGRIIGSLIYQLDKKNRIAKALGAVVSRDYRKHNLANTLMRIILDKITGEEQLVDAVYATTRTITTAPQQMTENLGFAALGIFPNAHRVYEHETHCLTGYYVPAAWKKRRKPVSLVKEAEPFYRLARKELEERSLALGEPKIYGEEYCAGAARQETLIPLEVISAPQFVRRRFHDGPNTGVFANSYMPFHEPNLLLISHDQKSEIYIHLSEKDRYTAILGGRSEEKSLSLLLNSAARTLRDFNVSYIELLVDAYSPELQWQAVNARFLPSAYFPAARLVGAKRWDYMIFSRSFEMLDFRNVTLMHTYREYLKEYLKVWDALYVQGALPGPEKK